MSLFDLLPELPEDPIFGLQSLYKADRSPQKCNLSLGVYVDEIGRVAPILKSVKMAEDIVFSTEDSKKYLPIGGDVDFVKHISKLMIIDGVGIQSVGGTSALRIGVEILRSMVDGFIISNPTWPNHLQILTHLGIKYITYPIDAKHIEVPKRFAALIQIGPHNPTGRYFSREYWEELAELFFKRKVITIFDSAYQGLGLSFEEDVFPLKVFADIGNEFLVAHSFSKSMGLYGERVGALLAVTRNNSRIFSHMKNIVRRSYSNPPRHGALIAKTIMEREDIRSLWMNEVKDMRERSDRLRKKLIDNFGDLFNGKGFFSLLSIEEEQVLQLRDKGIYLSRSGRINIPSINDNNEAFVIEGIKAALGTF